MTIIAAIHNPKIGTYISSDKQYSNNYEKRFGEHKWVSITPNFWVGFAGTFRILDVIREHKEDLVDGTESAFIFGNTLIKLITEYGFCPDSENHSSPTFEMQLLVATSLGISEIEGNFACFKIPSNTLAVAGSGSHFAMGAGYALKGKVDSKKLITTSVKAACSYDISSGGNPWVHLIPK